MKHSLLLYLGYAYFLIGGLGVLSGEYHLAPILYAAGCLAIVLYFYKRDLP